MREWGLRERARSGEWLLPEAGMEPESRRMGAGGN